MKVLKKKNSSSFSLKTKILRYLIDKLIMLLQT
jgi:hypothetical protein